MKKTTPGLLDMLNQLISAPSISSVSPEFDQSNMPVIDLLATWLEDLGFSVEVLPLEHQKNKANLIATLGTGDGGLVLAGHTDTVPYDEGQWNHNPFQLTEADNRLYGLGTSDMKGFFAVAIEAARQYTQQDLQHPLIILATADEESSMDGARELVECGRPQARYAVIGEPTGLRPVNMHKGILMESIHVHGHSGHSSNPALGANALEGMHKVLAELLAWREKLQHDNIDKRFDVPVPTLNLGHISGGDNPNRICPHSELHFDLRPLPGMHPEILRHDIDQRLASLFQDDAFEVIRRPLVEGTPAMHTASDSAIVKAAEQLTDHSAEAAAYCTEGPYLNSMGMETIILGPGDIDQAHQPDEFLSLKRMQPTIDLLQNLIEKFCTGTGA